MRLPVGLVGDGQAGQPGAVVVHDVVGAVCWAHDLHTHTHIMGQNGLEICILLAASAHIEELLLCLRLKDLRASGSMEEQGSHS